MGGVSTVAVNHRPSWLAGAERWNRRVSLAVAVFAGLATFILGWALTIKFGSWIGLFLGWWPALFVASFVALVAGRAWPTVPLLALVLLTMGDRGVALASNAFAANEAVAAIVGNNQQDPRPVTLSNVRTSRP